MKSVVLVGYSGHGHVCAGAILDCGYDLAGYCDTEQKILNPFEISYLGTEHDWLLTRKFDANFFVGIGNNKIRKRITEFLVKQMNPISIIKQLGSNVLADVDSKCLVFVATGATIQSGVSLGMGCIVNTSATIDHDCIIGEFAHVAPGAVLTGGVVVDECAFIGANATVLPGLQIGANATLGAGSVLTKHLPPGETWVGNPARPIRSKQLS